MTYSLVLLLSVECKLNKRSTGTYGSFDTIPDPANFLYGSGSREMIRIPRIRIRHTASRT